MTRKLETSPANINPSVIQGPGYPAAWVSRRYGLRPSFAHLVAGLIFGADR